MLKTVWAVVRKGKIELLENLLLSEGARVLVTVMPDEDEQQFWMEASERSLAAVWENTVGFLHSPSIPQPLSPTRGERGAKRNQRIRT
jgi:hypothetical protein